MTQEASIYQGRFLPDVTDVARFGRAWWRYWPSVSSCQLGLALRLMQPVDPQYNYSNILTVTALCKPTQWNRSIITVNDGVKAAEDGRKVRKHEPFKRKHRIKTSTPAEKKELVETTVPTTITVTDTNQEEGQDQGNETVEENNVQEEAKVEEAAEDKEETNQENQGQSSDNQKEDTEVKTEVKGVIELKAPLILNEDILLPAAKAGPTPKKAPKFKQRASRQFKSKPPKKGVLGFGDDIPGMDGLGTDITVICPWEAFSHLELHELAQFGII
ncbi:uncharacterized protein WCC33_014214 [Rhinophrynus dorsalis]